MLAVLVCGFDRFWTTIYFIDPQCDVNSIVTDAFENARFLCDRYYLTSPNLELECYNAVKKDSRVKITAIPSHLYHIAFELFKVNCSKYSRCFIPFFRMRCEQQLSLPVSMKIYLQSLSKWSKVQRICQ